MRAATTAGHLTPPRPRPQSDLLEAALSQASSSLVQPLEEQLLARVKDAEEAAALAAKQEAEAARRAAVAHATVRWGLGVALLARVLPGADVASLSLVRGFPIRQAGNSATRQELVGALTALSRELERTKEEVRQDGEQARVALQVLRPARPRARVARDAMNPTACPRPPLLSPQRASEESLSAMRTHLREELAAVQRHLARSDTRVRGAARERAVA